MDTLTRGSFLAVLRDGRHITNTSVYQSWDGFRRSVAVGVAVPETGEVVFKWLVPGGVR